MRQSQFWPACCTVTCARALRHGNSRLGKNRTEQGEGVFVSRSLTRTTPRETDLRYDELASGATVWGYQGNPFGEQQPTSSTGYVLNLRYPGQYYDAETETVYNGFRNYEPGLGRYLQSDPIGLNGGISTYAYVHNNPIQRVDPLGLDDTACVMDRSNCGWLPQAAPFSAAGIALTISTINPITYGSGGVYGLNLEYTDDAGLHLYSFYTPAKCDSTGLNPGVSLTANFANGSGPWTGPFVQTDASVGPVSGGFFETPDTGYFGGQLGVSAGTPYGLGQTIANYKVIW